MNHTDFEPMTPMEENTQATEQAAAPEYTRQPRRDKMPRPAQPKVRRVGFFTLGVALILTGGCIAASLMLQNFPLLTAAKLAPLVPVALGVEVLWANARKGDVYLTLAHTQGHSLFARGTSLLMPAKKGEHPKASALAGVTPGSPFSEV